MKNIGQLKKEFGKIYDQYIDKIYRFIYFKVSSPEITEDLCSETFLRGWLSYKTQFLNPKSQSKIENPPAFLFQIARNLVKDYYREKDKFEIISTEYYPTIIDPKMDLEEKIAKDSELNQIKKALLNLDNEDYKEAIILHYIEDLPISEVAKIMEKSEGATRVMLHRALKHLREKITKEI